MCLLMSKQNLPSRQLAQSSSQLCICQVHIWCLACLLDHFSLLVQMDECYNLVPVGFDAFVDDAEVNQISMLDNLISSVCAGELRHNILNLWAVLCTCASTSSA